MLKIEPAKEADFDHIWPIFSEIVRSGGTYVYEPDISPEEAKAIWFNPKFNTYIAKDDSGKVVGAYVIRKGHMGLGSHIANAAYIVDSGERGKGYGRVLGEHSLIEAKKLSYEALQFNYVISTNEPAVNLWKSLGFEIVGTVPDAYKPVSGGGYEDIHIMFRKL